jgi:ferredoxin
MKYQVTIQSREKNLFVECDENEPILQALINHNIRVSYSCLQGWCLGCAARLIDGQVDMKNARRFFPEDMEQGFILLCTAFPKSDIVIELNAVEAMKRNRKIHSLPYPKGDWKKSPL